MGEAPGGWLRRILLGCVCVASVGLFAGLVCDVPNRAAFGVQAGAMAFGVLTAVLHSWPDD